MPGINWNQIFSQGINAIAPLVIGAVAPHPGAGGHPTCQLDATFAAFHQIEAQIGQVPNANILAAMNAIKNDVLNNPAHNICDAAYLAQCKAVITHSLQVYTAQLGGGGSGITTPPIVVAGPGGVPIIQPGTTSANEFVQGVPNIYLLGGAGLLLLAVAVLRK